MIKKVCFHIKDLTYSHSCNKQPFHGLSAQGIFYLCCHKERVSILWVSFSYIRTLSGKMEIQVILKIIQFGNGFQKE